MGYSKVTLLLHMPELNDYPELLKATLARLQRSGGADCSKGCGEATILDDTRRKIAKLRKAESK